MRNTIIYPGTFDPITLGHMDLIGRAAKLFDKVIVAIAANARKSPVLSLTERVEMAKNVLAAFPSVDVYGFSGLMIEFAKEKNANVILRGLRAISDFEYEFQLAALNRRMAPELETVFMAPSDQFAYLSSSMIREITELGGDVSQFVHPDVLNLLKKRYQR